MLSFMGCSVCICVVFINYHSKWKISASLCSSNSFGSSVFKKKCEILSRLLENSGSLSIRGTWLLLPRPCATSHPWKRRHCHRGKRNECMNRLKTYMALFSASLNDCKMVGITFPCHRLTECIHTCLVPIVGPIKVLQGRISLIRREQRCINLENLSLCKAPRAVGASMGPAPVRFGQVNARSVSSKTFILKDFFTSA